MTKVVEGCRVHSGKRELGKFGERRPFQRDAQAD